MISPAQGMPCTKELRDTPKIQAGARMVKLAECYQLSNHEGDERSRRTERQENSPSMSSIDGYRLRLTEVAHHGNVDKSKRVFRSIPSSDKMHEHDQLCLVSPGVSYHINDHDKRHVRYLPQRGIQMDVGHIENKESRKGPINDRALEPHLETFDWWRQRIKKIPFTNVVSIAGNGHHRTQNSSSQATSLDMKLLYRILGTRSQIPSSLDSTAFVATVFPPGCLLP